MAQNRNGRRGAVFSVRVTDEERAKLEALQAQGNGPRSLGPWMLWNAITRGGTTEPGEVVPARVRGELERVLPELGYYRQKRRQNSDFCTACGCTRVACEAANLDQKKCCPDCSHPAGRVYHPLILDLCAGSGSWSKPYEAAGYRVVRVSLPDVDVRTYAPPADVHGVLCAPPCDQFSIARNGCDTPRDFVRGLETVSACMRVVLTCRPKWWALENPTGMLSRWLGTPRDVFEPCDFGDPWTKQTALWGDFTIPTRGPFVSPLGSGPICTVCDPSKRATTQCNNAAHRAVTPQGFARAFFEANP